MKKQITRPNLLAIAGALTFSLLFFSPGVQAQQEPESPKKIQIKMYQNVNGTITEKDTLVEIAAGGKLPDLSELKSFNRDLTMPDGKEHKVIFRNTITDSKNLDPAELEKLLEKRGELNRDVKIFRIEADGKLPREMGKERRVILNGEGGNEDPEKIRAALKDLEKLRPLMGDPEKLRENFKIADRPEVITIDREKFKFNSKEIEDLRIQLNSLEDLKDGNGIKMFTKAGDSILVIRKVYFVKVDLNDAERELLNEAAKKETSAKKVKDLNLESVELYPNPTSGKFRISFSAPQKGHTTVILRDGTGRELMRDELGSFKGNYEKEFDLGTQPKGVYFVQVVQGKQVFNKKVMLQ